MPVKYGSLAYKARQARKTADTRIRMFDKMAKDKSLSVNERAAAQTMSNRFREFKQNTYQQKGKRTAEADATIREAINTIRGLSRSAKIVRGKNGASNLLTQQQINIASRTYARPEDNVSIYTKAQVKVFYASTQGLWEHLAKRTGEFDAGTVDTAQINRAIMNGLKTTSLKEAFDFVLSLPENQAALVAAEHAEGTLPKEAMNAEERELFEQLSDNLDSDMGSPSYLNQVFEFDLTTDLRKLKQQLKE